MASNYDLFQRLSPECRALLNTIQKNGPVTFAFLMDALQLGRSRLQNMMSQLLEIHAVQESGYSESTGGRRSILYDVNSTDFLIIGVSVGSAKYGVCIANLKNQAVASSEFPMNNQITPINFAIRIHSEVRRMAEQCGLSADQFLGIGLSITGAVDCENGILLRQEANSFHKDWVGCPIRQILEETFCLPAAVDVYISMQTLEQYYYGHGKNSNRLLVITCGMAVGAGFLDRGHIVRSVNNMNNSFAHMIVDFDGRKCTCGNYGCLDCYSSARAIIHQVAQKLKAGVPSKLAGYMDALTISRVIQAAEQGDSLAASELEYAALILGAGLANYIRLVSPDTVILMGLIVSQFPKYGQIAIESAKKKLYSGFRLEQDSISFVQLDEWKRTGSDGSAMFIERLLNPNEGAPIKGEAGKGGASYAAN